MGISASDFLSAGTSLGGSLIGMFVNNHSARQQYKYNLALQQQAQQYNTSEREAVQDWNLAQWERQNEYNTPLAQRQRIQDAGYNPYMMQEGGQAGAVTSSPMSSGASSVGMANTGQLFADSGNRIADMIYSKAKVNSEVNRNNADASRAMADVGLIGSNKKRIESLLPYEQMQIDAYTDNLRADQKYKQEMEQLTTSQNIAQKLGNEYQKIINKYADQGQQQQLVKLASEIALISKQFDVNEAQRKELLSRVVKNYAEANLSNMHTKIAEKDLQRITDTLDTCIEMTNMENALETLTMSNLFGAEKLYGKGIAYNNASATYWNSRKMQHLELGSAKDFMRYHPVTANLVHSAGSLLGNTINVLPSLGMLYYSKKPKPITYQFF